MEGSGAIGFSHKTATKYMRIARNTHRSADLLEAPSIRAALELLSANVHRRHLTKGQQAMAVALAYPETQQGKKDTSQKNCEVNRESIRQARFIIRHCLEKAEGRNMNSSQKAMAYAKNFPDTKRGMGALSRNQDNEPLTKTEKNNISLARFILKHDPDKADLVRDGHPNWPPVRRH